MQAAPLAAATAGAIGQRSGNLPNSLVYTERASFSLEGKREKLNFPPENPSTFTPSNSVIRINILSTDRFIDLNDSRLTFDLTAKGTTPKHHLDGGASAIIQTLRILSPQGEELERLESYNLLSALLDQYETSLTDLPKKAVMEGSVYKFDPRFGLDPRDNDCLYAQSQHRYALKLKGAWFNTKQNKMLLPGIAFQIEVTLAAANTAFVQLNTLAAAAQTLDYEVTNVNLECPVVSIKDAAFAESIRRYYREGYWWTGKSYRLYTNTLTPGTGDAIIPISDRSHSLEGLVSILRTQTLVGSASEYSLSRRTIQPVEEYQATIGSVQVPVNRIKLECLGADKAGGAVERVVGRWVAATSCGFAGATTITIVTAAETPEAAGVPRVPLHCQFTLNAALIAGSPCVTGARFRMTGAVFGLAANSYWVVRAVSSATVFIAAPEEEVVPIDGASTFTLAAIQWEIPAENRLYQDVMRLNKHAMNVSEQMTEMKRVFPESELITADTFQNSEVNNGLGVLALDLKTFKDDKWIMSGKDTATNAVPISITVKRTAACNAGLQVDTYAIVDRTFMLTPSGSAQIGVLRSIV